MKWEKLTQEALDILKKEKREIIFHYKWTICSEYFEWENDRWNRSGSCCDSRFYDDEDMLENFSHYLIIEPGRCINLPSSVSSLWIDKSQEIAQINPVNESLRINVGVLDPNYVEIEKLYGPASSDVIRITIENYHWVIKILDEESGTWIEKICWPIQDAEKSFE